MKKRKKIYAYFSQTLQPSLLLNSLLSYWSTEDQMDEITSPSLAALVLKGRVKLNINLFYLELSYTFHSYSTSLTAIDIIVNMAGLSDLSSIELVDSLKDIFSEDVLQILRGMYKCNFCLGNLDE